MLRDWNNAVKHGCTNQATFNRIIANADDNTKMYFAGLNKGKGSLKGLKAAQNATKTSTVGLTIAQTALNMAISMGLMAAISLAIKGFDKMINHAKRASEASDEAFEETSSKVQEQQEELKTLDELISKYRELKKDGALDIEGRKEVKELQNDIADLVGTQARNLDLVNGKLDDEIEKLDEISAREAKKAYETATANYNNSQRANQNAAGDDSYMFFDGYAYTGSREKDAEKILKEYGFGDNVQSGGLFGNTLFITDSFDNDMNALEGAQEKADYLQSMIDVLEQNGQRATELYSGLISQRDKYLGYIDSQQGAANSLVNSWITYSQYSNEELSNITVNSVESFETYRQKMIEAAKNDESVGKLLSDGTLSEKDLETAVNDFMATSTKFSDWYKQWIGDVQDTGENANKMTVSIGKLASTSDKIKVLSSAFKELSGDGYITTKTLEEIKTAAGLSDTAWESYEATLLNVKIGSAEFNQILSDLTYRIIENEFTTEGLKNATEEQVAAILRENGVLNAEALAVEYVNRAKASSVITTEKLSDAFDENGNAIDGNIKDLIAEGTQLGLTESQMYSLIAAEIAFNSNELSTKDKIARLNAIAKAAGLATIYIDGLNSAVAGMEDQQTDWGAARVAEERAKYVKESDGEYEVVGYTTNKYGVTVEDWRYTRNGETYENFGDYSAAVEIEKMLNELNDAANFIDPNYSSSSSSSNSNTPDYEDPTEAIINRINLRSNELKQQEEYIENDIETAKIEKDYAKQISSTNNLIANRKKRVEELNTANAALHNEAEYLRNSNPWDEDSWFDSQGNATETYYNLYNSASTKEEQEKIKNLFESLSSYKKAYAKNTEEIHSLNKELIKDEETLADLYGEAHEGKIRDIEHSRDMALEQNPYLDTTSYYRQMQEEYHSEAERLRALDPEKYKEEIQELQENWWSAQESIVDEAYSNTDRWINERNTYGDWELHGDNEVAAWERLLDKFKTEFPNELEKIKDIEQNIFEARKEAMEKSISDIDDYIDARNAYNDWDAYGDNEVKAVQRQTKIIQDAYKDRLLSYDEYIDRLEEQNQRLYSLGQEQVDKHLSNIDKYIDARNTYNDWDAFGDSEIEAIKRQCRILDEAYRLNLISLEKYTEKSAEYTQRLYSISKENIIETISELVEDYEEMKQLESSKLESQKTLLQSYYDVTNAVAEAQREINKELRASMAMYEYLNEDTRELLFNQEDHKALSEELLDIQSAADELQKQYQKDILNANAETISEITEQYQMQYETLMKQYEIAKAELEVAKKRQKLDNVLAERNTRMFINGQWQWVANTQDVINAQNELADAEIERKKQEAALEQTGAINSFTTQINALETDLNKVRKYWADIQEMLNGEADEVAKALKEISKVSSPELKKVIKETGGSIFSFTASLSDSTSTLSTVISGDLSSMSVGIDTIITDLQNYSAAIQELTAEIENSSSSSGGKVLQVGADGNAPAGATIGDTIVTAGGNYKIVSAGTPGATYNPASGHWSVKVSSPSSSTKVSNTTVSSSTPSSKKVNTTDQYVKDDLGYIQSNPNWDGKKQGGVGSFYKYAKGTRYTAGGLSLMGEDGEEFYIPSNGRLIPINQPTIGNIGAGGIVFNREQMANLRNLWDLSNLGKISPYVSSSNTSKQSTVIDNSIHINGLTVGEQGNEDWINGLRRYVATHK